MTLTDREKVILARLVEEERAKLAEKPRPCNATWAQQHEAKLAELRELAFKLEEV